MHFFICFTLRCFHFLKRLRAFLRQWNCCLSLVFSEYWWPPSTLSKRSSNSLASEAPITFSFDPQSTNQQQGNCPYSWLQGWEHGTLIQKWKFRGQGPVVWSIRNTSQLGGSKIPLRHFYYLGWFHWCDPSWHSIHSCRVHPVVFLTICCWPSTDEKQTWRSPDPVSGYPCHSYLLEFAMCAWLQSLSQTVFSTLGLLILRLPEFKLIFLL